MKWKMNTMMIMIMMNSVLDSVGNPLLRFNLLRNLEASEEKKRHSMRCLVKKEEEERKRGNSNILLFYCRGSSDIRERVVFTSEIIGMDLSNWHCFYFRVW